MAEYGNDDRRFELFRFGFMPTQGMIELLNLSAVQLQEALQLLSHPAGCLEVRFVVLVDPRMAVHAKAQEIGAPVVRLVSVGMVDMEHSPPTQSRRNLEAAASAGMVALLADPSADLLPVGGIAEQIQHHIVGGHFLVVEIKHLGEVRGGIEFDPQLPLADGADLEIDLLVLQLRNRVDQINLGRVAPEIPVVEPSGHLFLGDLLADSDVELGHPVHLDVARVLEVDVTLVLRVAGDEDDRVGFV